MSAAAATLFSRFRSGFYRRRLTSHPAGRSGPGALGPRRVADGDVTISAFPVLTQTRAK